MTSSQQAARAGEAVGRGYARTTAALVAPVRRAPAPAWPRRAVLARVTAGRRRVRNVPRRLVDGVRQLLAGKRRKAKAGQPVRLTKKRPEKPNLGRVGAAGLVGWVGWTWAAEEGVLPYVLGAAVLAAAGAAYAAGTEPETPPAADPPSAPAKTGEQPPAGAPQRPPAVDPLLTLCALLIGDGRGVHLDALTAALNEAAPSRTRAAAEVRDALTRRGVPTRASVRAPEGATPGARERVRRGVHREDLEAVLCPLPAAAPKASAEPVATPATPALTSDVAAIATAVAGAVAAPAHTRESV